MGRCWAVKDVACDKAIAVRVHIGNCAFELGSSLLNKYFDLVELTLVCVFVLKRCCDGEFHLVGVECFKNFRDGQCHFLSSGGGAH